MANLTATSSFDAVLQLETTHQAIGGAGGTMNLQAQALTNRTQYLLDQVNTKTTLTEVKSNLNVTGSAPMYVARTWVNFNGTGVVAIRSSGNVSSITDRAIGDYTVNFTTALPTADYAVALTSSWGGNLGAASISIDNTTLQTTTSFGVKCRWGGDNTNGSFDPAIVNAVIVY